MKYSSVYTYKCLCKKKCACENQWWVVFNILRYPCLLDVIHSDLTCHVSYLQLCSRRTLKSMQQIQIILRIEKENESQLQNVRDWK